MSRLLRLRGRISYSVRPTFLSLYHHFLASLCSQQAIQHLYFIVASVVVLLIVQGCAPRKVISFAVVVIIVRRDILNSGPPHMLLAFD